jgi:hypothetical protein
LPVRHRRPNQPVHVLHGLDLRLDDTHPNFTIPPVPLSPCQLTLYNTVVLVSLAVLNVSEYQRNDVTSADAELVVTYRLFGLRQHRTIRLMSDDVGSIVWKLKPDGEPPVPDGFGGYKLTAPGAIMTVRIDRVSHGVPASN